MLIMFQTGVHFLYTVKQGFQIANLFYAICSSSKVFSFMFLVSQRLYFAFYIEISSSRQIVLLSIIYYGVAIASPYVGMTRKQDGGSNQCISIYTAVFFTGKYMLASKST